MQHYTTSGHNFSVLTSAPVNICILLPGTRFHRVLVHSNYRCIGLYSQTQKPWRALKHC